MSEAVLRTERGIPSGTPAAHAAATYAGQGHGLALKGVTKRYGTVAAVEKVTLEIRRSELFCLLGPSGSGKTTTLHLIAGFVTPDEGEVVLNDRDITRVAVNQRRLGVVFQDYALFPHMTARDNIAYGLRARRASTELQSERSTKLLRLVGLEHAANRLPRQLSGGEQQRVAVARALAIEPEMLLLDEPLSNLDARLRIEVATELRRIQRETGVTTLMVTHDQQEAFALADRIAVMSAGRIMQVGTPRELYRRPVDMFVARFIGRANFIDGEVVEVGQPVVVRGGGALYPATSDRPVAVGSRVTVMIRPEAIRIRAECSSRWCLHGALVGHSYHGPSLTVHVRTEDQLLEVLRPATRTDQVTSEGAHLDWDPEDAAVMPAERGDAPGRA